MLYFSAPKAKPNQAFLIQGPLQDSNTPSQSTSKVDTCAKVKIKKGRTDTEEWIEAIIDQDQSKIEPTKVKEEGSENAPHTPSTEPKNTSTRNWWRAAADIINSGLDWFLIFVKFIKLTLLLSS